MDFQLAPRSRHRPPRLARRRRWSASPSSCSAGSASRTTATRRCTPPISGSRAASPSARCGCCRSRGGGQCSARVLAAMLGLVALEREPVASAAGWIVAELAGVAAAGFLLRRFAGEARLDSLDKVWRFLLAGALVNAVVSGAIGAPVFAAVFGKPALAEWRAWVLAHAIGVTLVAPVVVSWAALPRQALRRPPARAVLGGTRVPRRHARSPRSPSSTGRKQTAIIAAGGRALDLEPRSRTSRSRSPCSCRSHGDSAAARSRSWSSASSPS